MSPHRSIAIPGSEEPVLSKAVITGKLDPGEWIEVVLVLRFGPCDSQLELLERLTKEPSSHHEYMSHTQLETLLGSTYEDLEKIEDFAREYELSISDIDLGHRTIHLTGTAAAMEKAFDVSLCKCSSDEVDAPFRSHQGAVKIPEDLKDLVLGVLGLSNPTVVGTSKYDENIISNAQCFKLHSAQESPYFNPREIAQLYNFPSDATGKGQTIGIIQAGGGYYREHLREYFEGYLGIPMPKITSMSVHGGHNNPGKNLMYDSEVCVDMEIVGAIAPDAHIVVYFAPDTSYLGLYEALHYAIHNKTHRESVISISWGNKECRNSAVFMALINQLLQEAALLGITVCASSGDYGSSNVRYSTPSDGTANVDFPASSPWVLACGGTRLYADSEKASILKEVVWNDGILGATGGGVSSFFSTPDYQAEAGINPTAVNPGSRIGRGVPDVAGNASHETGYITKVNDKSFINMGGTSAVAPMWAGLVALLNEKLNTRLGFINPLLYQIPESAGAFNRITEGNNQYVSEVPGYSAGPGWNACTGLGTPNGEKLYEALKEMLAK